MLVGFLFLTSSPPLSLPSSAFASDLPYFLNGKSGHGLVSTIYDKLFGLQQSLFQLEISTTFNNTINGLTSLNTG